MKIFGFRTINGRAAHPDAHYREKQDQSISDPVVQGDLAWTQSNAGYSHEHRYKTEALPFLAEMKIKLH